MCVGRKPNSTHIDRTKVPMTVTISKQRRSCEESCEETYTGDVLAVVTYYTKKILFGIYSYRKTLINFPIIRTLSETTQPAHFVTALAVLITGFLIFPSNTPPANLSILWTLIYLGSFSVHFGAQIWMTFISGLALYFSLPRHTFGSVQQVLFPKYFSFSTFLSLVTSAIFLRAKNADLMKTEIAVQASGLVICFLAELLIRLYLAPPLLQLIAVKIEIEKEAGIGLEVGQLDAKKLLQCPHYFKIHKRFRKIHASIAMGNMLTLACTVMHLFYLSKKFSTVSL